MLEQVGTVEASVHNVGAGEHSWGRSALLGQVPNIPLRHLIFK